MVVFNYSGAEINAKVVYYGPALSGKTTNLESIYEKMPSNAKGKMVSMKTRTDRTLFFDFLPLELGEISGYRTRILLYTVPGQVYYNATRKLVLKGADAVVFVADSDPAKMDENIESLRNLEENLNEYDLTLDTIPWIIQYNKRDVPNALSVEALDAKLNLLNVPSYEAVATTGQGIYETFKGIAGILYNHLIERIEGAEGAKPNPAAQTAAQVSAQTPPPPPAPVQAAAQEAANTTSVTAMADGPAEGEEDVENVIDAALREVEPTTPAPKTKTTKATDAEEPIIDSEVGNVIDFDSTSETSHPPPEAGEFITDPFKKKDGGQEKAPAKGKKASSAPPKPPAPEKAAAKPAAKAEAPAPKAAAPAPKAPAAAPKAPAPAPKAPATPRGPAVPKAPSPPLPVAPPQDVSLAAHTDAVTISVPVVLKRSETSSSVPIRVELEIEIVDD